MAGKQANPPTPIEGFREGSRWIHEKPTGDELAAWFKENVKLHEGLEHKDYITGIVLIPQREKHKQTTPNGAVIEVERLTYTPYPTTGARVAYLRDWVAAEAAKRGQPLLWEIVPDEHLKRAEHLPGGFFAYTPKWKLDNGHEMTSPFVGCSMQLRVYERNIRDGGKGHLILNAPAGSKVVPVVKWGKADENALMKAQTGSIGRTLAFAGMLVIPGTGVATAEDVQESVAAGVPLGGEAAPAELPEEPVAPADPQDLRQQAAELIGSLQEHPAKLEEVREWAKGREIDLSDIPEDALRGAVRLLEKKLREAQKPEPLDTGQSTDN